MKKKLITIYLKYQAYIWSLLSPLGIWGPGIISAIDSAAFGIPMDIVMIGYAAREREHLLLVGFYCVTAAVGSAIGSLVPYWLGRRGGEPFLLKRISHAKLERMRDRFEKQEFLFILFPSMLPPPTPFKMLVFCAGVFEMKVGQFIAAIVIGRTLRFTIVSYITIRFGETIAKQVLVTVAQHLPWVLAAFLLAFALYFVYWMRGRKGREEMLEI